MVYSPPMRPSRCGKSRFTRPGSSTLQSEIAAPQAAVPASRAGRCPASAGSSRGRSSSPAVSTAIAPSSTRSAPKRRARTGASGAKTPEQRHRHRGEDHDRPARQPGVGRHLGQYRGEAGEHGAEVQPDQDQADAQVGQRAAAADPGGLRRGDVVDLGVRPACPGGPRRRCRRRRSSCGAFRYGHATPFWQASAAPAVLQAASRRSAVSPGARRDSTILEGMSESPESPEHAAAVRAR